MKKMLICVYCGYRYPQGISLYDGSILSNHLSVCVKHPLRKAESDIALLRNALVGLVGADGREELEKMEAYIRSSACIEDDRAVSVNTIHALLKTLPGE